ncbi:hypothetical protein PGT21_002922 [Puccinia graminis f. sp. tritici]|uniref:Uncharacterized protein n=1 Tax=Puccinia graminis f. sp. tritici TaxID=56615 RepID=A0A5B0PM05_PUCGR|nr:hypothetical protein PGT21_002922 [Puccinia graminis f. sp. tritici]
MVIPEPADQPVSGLHCAGRDGPGLIRTQLAIGLPMGSQAAIQEEIRPARRPWWGFGKTKGQTQRDRSVSDLTEQEHQGP